LEGLDKELEERDIAKLRPRSEILVDAELRAEKNKKLVDQQDRAVFVEICQKFRIANNDANFNLLRSHIRHGVLTEDRAAEVINSGAVQLARASAEELQQIEAAEKAALAEFCEQGLRGQLTGKIFSYRPPYETFEPANRVENIQRLQSLSLDHLKQIQAVIEQNQLAKRQVGIPQPIITPRNQFNGKPPLPEFDQDGQKIDRKYLLRLSAAPKESQQYEKFKNICRIHGTDAVNQRFAAGLE
jgi:hypothetical protein